LNARFLSEVEAEVRAAALWYEEQQPGMADRFLDAGLDAQFEIEKYPLRFPPPTGVRKNRPVRRRLLDGFPYTMIYELRDNELLVLAIAHTSRQPGYWINRRG